MWKALLWFPLLVATLSVLFEPSPKLILFLCAISFLSALSHVFTWADSVKKRPLPRTRLYILFFGVFYLYITYVFSLVYYALSLLGHNLTYQICCDKSPLDYFYFSVLTATTLGYGDLLPSGVFTRVISIVEVSFGVIFLTAVLTVVLALRNGAGESRG